MSKTIERKVRHLQFEIKDLSEDGTFSGYGSKFGVVDYAGDVLVKGAFEKTLADVTHKVRLLWQHDSKQPIGHFKSLSEDANGLHFTGKLNLDVQQGREAYALLKAGDIEGMSIGFITIKDDYDRQTGIRYIKEVKLSEISLVTFPANAEATVQSVKEIRSSFDSLTEEQRVQVLTLINSFKQSLSSEEPPTSEASDGKHSDAEGADTSTTEEPQADIELLHSLEQLKKSMTLNQ